MGLGLRRHPPAWPIIPRDISNNFLNCQRSTRYRNRLVSLNTARRWADNSKPSKYLLVYPTEEYTSFLSIVNIHALNLCRLNALNLKYETMSEQVSKRLKMGESGTNKSDESENGVNLGIGFNDVDFSDRVLQLQITPLASDKGLGAEKFVNCFSSIDANDSEYGSDFIVKTFSICSLVLASKSPFFLKLFKIGMKESQKKNDVILRINAAEEAALMDLLYFMYDKPMNATSEAELVDLLMAADKFEVPSCVQHCIQLLLKFPMTTQSALSYMELPSSIFVGQVTRPLIDAAKQCLASHFSYFNGSKQEEAMSLPLCAVEAVLGSDDLKVTSDEAVLDFILKWVRLHYPKVEERREILTNRLVQFVCFPCLSSSKLKEVVVCPDFEYDKVSKLVLNALFTKIEQPNGHKSVPVNTTMFPKEVLIACGFPRHIVNHRRVVYFGMKKQECLDKLPLPSGVRLYSKVLCLSGRRFRLFVQRAVYKSAERFGVFVEMTGPESCTLFLGLAVMEKPSRRFQIKTPAIECSLTETARARGEWLFQWDDLMRENSMYFIDGILHLRAEINLRS